MPSLPSLSRQEKCSSTIIALFSSTMALLSLGYGSHRTRDSESFKRPWVHLGGHRLFYKVWVEAALYRSVTQAVVAWFLKHSNICCYDMPRELITDNETNLNGKIIQQLCQQFKIEHKNSVPYRPQMNCIVEVTNKNIKKIFMKMIDTYKDWHEYFPFALCAYRTSVCTSMGATPYSLVYSMEAVLPAKVEILSLRNLSQTELSEAKWAHSRYQQLNMIDEKCMTVMCHGQLYQHRVKRAFNKKVRPSSWLYFPLWPGPAWS